MTSPITLFLLFTFFSQSVKDQLAELEKIIEDVTKYFPEQKNLVPASRKNLAFKHIDSLLLERNVREWNVFKRYSFWCVVLPFWLLFATFWQLFPIFLCLAFKHIDSLLLERSVRLRGKSFLKKMNSRVLYFWFHVTIRQLCRF